MMQALRASGLQLTLLLGLFACGDNEAPSGGGGAGGTGGGGGADSRFFPEGNGDIATEADACQDLYETLLDQASTLACVATVQSCPALIQKLGPTSPCSQYDAGSVAGCVSYFEEAADCDELTTRAPNCVPEAIPDSAPLGCPEG